MIVQAKNNISHHNTPPLASLAGAEVISATSINGTSRQQHQSQQQQPPPQPPPAPTSGPPHYVDLHVNAGECVSLQLLDGQEQVVAGPATITMISQQQNPPVPIPVQVSNLLQTGCCQKRMAFNLLPVSRALISATN